MKIFQMLSVVTFLYHTVCLVDKYDQLILMIHDTSAKYIQIQASEKNIKCSVQNLECTQTEHTIYLVELNAGTDNSLV